MMKRIFLISSICLILGGLSAEVWADEPQENAENNAPNAPNDCTTLETNTAWHDKFAEFTKTYTAKDYQKALDITKELQAICADSPILNYSIGMTYRSLGDHDNALKYLNTATLNTETFKVDHDLIQRMYYAQYEVENLDPLQADKTGTVIANNADLDVQKVQQRNAILMWTGVGLMGAGALLQLGLIKGSKHQYFQLNSTHDEELCINTYHGTFYDGSCYEPDASYQPSTLGMALSGVGIGLAVAGAIMTGIAGYAYTHPSKDKKVSMSYQISPTHLGFGMTF